MEVINMRNSYIEEKNKGLIKTFFRMFLGLLMTALAAYATYQSGLYMTIPYGVLAIVEIVVVLLFSFLFRKLSPTMVTILYFGYALINGITMATIFAVFDISTISYAFLTTAFLFGGLALYGYTTKKDMSRFSTIFTVTLIVGLIVSLINLFVGNSLINIVLDWVMLFVFCGLTAYDMNRITSIQNYTGIDDEKVYVYGAMELYLDFINIFIRLLSIFARIKSHDD